MTFAERLIEIFDGASMAEIARQLKVPHSTIRNYVQQNRLPAADVLIAISTRTNVSIDWLLTGRGQKRRPPLPIAGENSSLDENRMIRLQELWRETFDEEISDSELINSLINRGESSIASKIGERKVDELLDTIELAGKKNYVLAQSIVAIVREEILNGGLTDAVREAVSRRDIQDLGTIDEFLADAIQRHDEPGAVLEEWYNREGWPLEQLSVPEFANWNDLTLTEKISEIKRHREDLVRHIKRNEMLSPKEPDADS